MYEIMVDGRSSIKHVSVRRRFLQLKQMTARSLYTTEFIVHSGSENKKTREVAERQDAYSNASHTRIQGKDSTMCLFSHISIITRHRKPNPGGFSVLIESSGLFFSKPGEEQKAALTHC